MAVRRRYKERQEVPVDVAEPEAAPVAAPVETPPDPVAESPLMAQIAAHRRAEELQRQRQPTSIEQHIDNMPDLTPHKRSFLKAYPIMLNPAVMPLMARHYRAGLQHFPDDTTELDGYILANVARDIDQHQRLMQAQAAPAPESAPPEQETLPTAVDLAREAEALYAEHYAEAPAAIPAPRRSIPMSAPVSRDIPLASGGRTSRADNTLSPDEREIARVSFPHLPHREAEYAYLQNRKRMREMKADGRIQGDR